MKCSFDFLSLMGILLSLMGSFPDVVRIFVVVVVFAFFCCCCCCLLPLMFLVVVFVVEVAVVFVFLFVFFPFFADDLLELKNCPLTTLILQIFDVVSWKNAFRSERNKNRSKIFENVCLSCDLMDRQMSEC